MSITISQYGFPAKPNSKDGKKHHWCRNLRKFDGTIQQIAYKISQGYTIYTNVLDLNTNNGYSVDGTRFEESEWIGLDFDNEVRGGAQLQAPDYLTMEDCLTKMKNMGLYPAVVYPTFSFTPEHHKFRVLFHLNEVIPKENQRKLCILIVLMNLIVTLGSKSMIAL